MQLFTSIFQFFVGHFRSSTALSAEILFLRHQLIVATRNKSKFQFGPIDRFLLARVFRFVPDWKGALKIAKPDTLVKWHRKGFKLFWKWKSGAKNPGRPPIEKEIRNLIKTMRLENVGWGAPRIHAELEKLGYTISESTVQNYLKRFEPKGRKPASQTWKTFLDNHAKGIMAMDFLVVPTITFRLLYVLIFISHDRRRIVFFNVTKHPDMEWTHQQIRNALQESDPKYLIHDNDPVFSQVRTLFIESVRIAPRSPWQNAIAERMIGSIRRECLDYIIVTGERHLKLILKDYFSYYQINRTHLSLAKDSPLGREIETQGKVVSLPKVGGLHHYYGRMSA